MPDSKPVAAAQLSTTPDKTATLISTLIVVLSAFHVPTKLGLSPDEFASVLGNLLMVICAMRAWWEGTQLAKGGSLADPVGVIGGSVVSLLGSFDVMTKLELTPDQVVGLISGAFTSGAGVRVWMRTKLSRTENSAPPTTPSAPPPPAEAA